MLDLLCMFLFYFSYNFRILKLMRTIQYAALLSTRRGTRRCPGDRRVDEISGRPYIQNVHTPASGRIANV